MNINDEVLVTLTDHGMRVLAEIEGEHRVYSRHNMDGRDLRVSLWVLMQLFGGAMHVGSPTCFEQNRVTLMNECPTVQPTITRLETKGAKL